MWWRVVPLYILTVAPAQFAPETLFGRDIDHGGFTGPVVEPAFDTLDSKVQS